MIGAALAMVFAGLTVPAATPCGALRPTAKPMLEHRRGRPPRAAGGLRDRLLAVGALRLARAAARLRPREDRMVDPHRRSGQRSLPGRALVRDQPTDVAGVCEKYGPAIAILLDKNEIQAVGGQHVRAAERDRRPDRVRRAPGLARRRERQDPVRRHPARHAGGKRLGSVYRVDVTAGEPPLGEPKIRGMLRNPFERRVAVFVTQDMAPAAGMRDPDRQGAGRPSRQGLRPEPLGAEQNSGLFLVALMPATECVGRLRVGDRAASAPAS